MHGKGMDWRRLKSTASQKHKRRLQKSCFQDSSTSLEQNQLGEMPEDTWGGRIGAEVAGALPLDFLIRGGGDGEFSLESSECSSDSAIICFPLLAGILYLLAEGAGDGDADERFDHTIFGFRNREDFWNSE